VDLWEAWALCFSTTAARSLIGRDQSLRTTTVVILTRVDPNMRATSNMAGTRSVKCSPLARVDMDSQANQATEATVATVSPRFITKNTVHAPTDTNIKVKPSINSHPRAAMSTLATHLQRRASAARSTTNISRKARVTIRSRHGRPTKVANLNISVQRHTMDTEVLLLVGNTDSKWT
jgi:CCR4-NOT transcriptional regulation complex NOT5 subunit